jgi:hypothetical protein
VLGLSEPRTASIVTAHEGRRINEKTSNQVGHVRLKSTDKERQEGDATKLRRFEKHPRACRKREGVYELKCFPSCCSLLALVLSLVVVAFPLASVANVDVCGC